MPGAPRDPRTGLPPRAAGKLHDVPTEKPLHPRNITRSTVYCQASIRRFLNTRRRLRGITALRPPNPPVATGLFFCRHLRSPNFIDIEEEAICVCALICGREEGKGLKLGDLSDAYLEYSPHLPAGHPALAMLLERFDDVVVDAEEDGMQRMQEATTPSEAETQLREAMLAWRSPEDRPGPRGGQLFKLAKEKIEKLRLEHEQVLIARLPMVNNQEAYAAMMAEVEREFVGAQTILRGQVRAGRNQQRAMQEMEMTTMYGWPPTGPGPALKRAARKYILELGSEHPVVEDFVAAARRHVKMKENKCIQEMTPLEEQILHFRGLYEADPPAPKLMRDNYREQMNERCFEAMEKLKDWRLNLGEDSFVYLRFLRSTLGEEAFFDDREARAAAVAEDLRACGPRAPPGLEENDVTEDRTVAATSLTFVLETLEAGGRRTQATALRAEFPSELKRVEYAVKLFKDEEDEDEGWHKPPGFENVDTPQKPPAKPPTPPPPEEIRLERKLPGMREGQSLSMRLHGVDFEDVRRHNEFLLLEMCADVIAEECGIPRDCIFNMSFTEVKQLVAEPPPEADAELPDGATSKELVTEDGPARMDSSQNPASST